VCVHEYVCARVCVYVVRLCTHTENEYKILQFQPLLQDTTSWPNLTGLPADQKGGRNAFMYGGTFKEESWDIGVNTNTFIGRGVCIYINM